MRTPLDRAVLIYFVACGVSRLARFNVTADELADGGDKVKYFEGTPIPTSVLLVGVLAVAAWRGRTGRGPVVRGGGAAAGGPSSPGAHVRRLGQPDDQQDRAGTQAVTAGSSTSEVHERTPSRFSAQLRRDPRRFPWAGPPASSSRPPATPSCSCAARPGRPTTTCTSWTVATGACGGWPAPADLLGGRRGGALASRSARAGSACASPTGGSPGTPSRPMAPTCCSPLRVGCSCWAGQDGRIRALTPAGSRRARAALFARRQAGSPSCGRATSTCSIWTTAGRAGRAPPAHARGHARTSASAWPSSWPRRRWGATRVTGGRPTAPGWPSPR